jgi:hypothetical protein
MKLEIIERVMRCNGEKWKMRKKINQNEKFGLKKKILKTSGEIKLR